MTWIKEHSKMIGSTAGVIAGAVIAAAAEWGLDVERPVQGALVLVTTVLTTYFAPANA
jgi:hypothetical protein